MTDLTASWQNRIERDLAPFVDPNTELFVVPDGRIIEATWTQQHLQRSARFKIPVSGEGIEVEFGREKLTYAAFFASEQMANLFGIAKGTLSRFDRSIYVDTLAKLPSQSNSASESAVRLIETTIGQSDAFAGHTNVIMMTGEAGAGKTSVLKQFVRIQADAYARGQAKFVALYIDAQGRALARFNEAVATELNDLRVMLPFHAVPTLVRLGLIVPVIDGFDELIGVGGYDDAFNSISAFIEELDGSGVLVASARSTYYEQEFLTRANRESALGEQSWRLTSIETLAWEQKQRDAYVDKRCSDESRRPEIQVAINKLFSGANSALAGKPLFVAKTVDFILGGGALSESGDMLGQLVSAFLDRERQDKLRDKTGRPILDARRVEDLCEDLAEEMWSQGTRELDRGTVRELAEISISGVQLPSQSRQVVIERMPTFAFLQPGEAVGSVAFEHEIFFAYFLAKRMTYKLLKDAAGLDLLFGRSLLPDTIADSIAANLAGGSEFQQQAKKVCEILCRVASGGTLRSQQVRENCGRCFAAIARLISHCGAKFESFILSNLVFPGVSLHGVAFDNCSLREIDFRSADLTGARFDNCDASGVIFQRVLIDLSTHLGITGVTAGNFSGLRLASDSGQITQIFDPLKVNAELKSVGLPSALSEEQAAARSVDTHVVNLVERLARAYTRCNPVCVQDTTFGQMFNDALWPEVERIAIDSQIVKQEARAAHGPRRKFLRRLVLPEDLMAGYEGTRESSHAVESFWKALEAAFPGKGGGGN